MSEHVHGSDCPQCGHPESETVAAQIEGRGAMNTLAIRECQKCGQLWGEPRDFRGVTYDD